MSLLLLEVVLIPADSLTKSDFFKTSSHNQTDLLLLSPMVFHTTSIQKAMEANQIIKYDVYYDLVISNL